MKLAPFSHRPGASLLIPSTSHVVEAYPTRVRYGDKELALDLKGPVKNFTVMQDLERCCVTVFSNLYRFHILPSLEVIHAKHPHTPKMQHERLDFGAHKKQEFEAMRKRGDFRELLPIWYRLGMLLDLPQIETGAVGMFALLEQARNAQPEQILTHLHTLYMAGFSEGFVPRTEDYEHQGLVSEISPTDPLYLLTEGAKLIRSLFIRVDAAGLAILPHLPPELFAGKFLGIETPFATVDLVWTKKSLRTLTLHAKQSCQLKIQFPPHLKTFRLGKQVYSTLTPLQIEPNTTYFLDRFQK